MSVSCGAEWVVVLGCMRWAWKRCTYIGSDDSATWGSASADEFEAIPRACRTILGVYEPGTQWVKPEWVVKRANYEQTLGNAPPYLIYADHQNREIVLAIRGLNLANQSDYRVLLDNRLGMQMFDGGYVHNGLLKSAVWMLKRESETLRRLWEENGREYKMVFAGHSLGSGVAALLAVIVANHAHQLGGLPRTLLRCYAVAPARCMSLNLAVKYADIIHSLVLQDDFLPRTPTPLEDIFKSVFCLPCLLFFVCLRDTFIPEGRKLKDQRRLYAPGRMYHIVERKFCRCGRFPPEVRTAIPVDGRFEHIVLSCNATSDHAIVWIEREAQKALKNLQELNKETVMTPPKVEKFNRKLTLEKEHKDALERAVSLNIPHAETSYEESSGNNEEGTSQATNLETCNDNAEDSSEKEKPVCKDPRTNWDEVVEKLFKKNESGKMLLKRDVSESIKCSN
ncbi:uncharacterized protein LOC131021884 [Salvia miltiorrhiza]|uniref:uncharacterized protein LOC131021884 n=1 Tax=Salvia miltiorrhiza TaxID=226208 RepID=UPI0025ABBF12|nr:uncharacterized protein LOC131021884 [Salvia miltiorrhiza]